MIRETLQAARIRPGMRSLLHRRQTFARPIAPIVGPTAAAAGIPLNRCVHAMESGVHCKILRPPLCRARRASAACRVQHDERIADRRIAVYAAIELRNIRLPIVPIRATMRSPVRRLSRLPHPVHGTLIAVGRAVDSTS
jgi:hypothetical protein